ncbi:ABC transporter permease [Ostreibacterium oceani]|uniref:ABC transporter permease subunit n=1 Tax=Ostreibacterium oceani TaxID=2654998 RepID=A0A6N7ESA3_9GAMM|nr:ABC transporter permease [Ostreibacterium oceani]MPV85421.1 ABC transporter permease subunit [Ostreibacterium oceani]
MADTLTTASGVSLEKALKRADSKARRRAFLLVLPLLLFLLITFIGPIASMIWRSVYNPEVHDYLPNTAAALENWEGEQLPDEAVYAALYEDIKIGQENRTIGRVAGRLNRELPGTRGLMMGAARNFEEFNAPYKESFIAADEDWGDVRFWKLVKRETGLFTISYYLLAMDKEYNLDGEIVDRDEKYQIYGKLFKRTFFMSALITFLCIVLAYPISYLMAILPLRKSNLLMILVLLPFWTSLLVRTSAWIVLLQSQGVVNDLLVWSGLINNESRLQMIYNATGTTIAMVHILLPFVVLPLYSVMKTIQPSYMRAAISMGAHPFVAWWRIYFPLTLPGLAAGVILVFIIAIGYYITPALVGGQTGIFISNLIADNMRGTTAQLKLALSLASLLLIAVMILYWLFNKLVGVDRLKFG